MTAFKKIAGTPLKPAPSNQQTQWVLYTLLLGGTVVSFSNSALNPAIPVFMAQFNVSIVTGSWILNGYVLAMSIGLVLTGYLSSRFWQKHLYIFAITCFMVGSLFGALAHSINTIIFARAIQGFAGGIIIPLSIGMIYQLYPKHYHGRMMALWGIVIMMSLAFGPLIGAYLIEVFAWWVLFISTLPLAILVILMAWRLLPKTLDLTYKNQQKQVFKKQVFDWLGFLGLLLWLLTFMWWVEAIDSSSSYGFLSLSLGFIGFAFVWWGYETPNHAIIKNTPKHPILDLTLFKNVVYLHSSIISVSQTLVLMLCLLLLPVIIQDIMQQSALWTGVILMLSTLAASATTHFAGNIVDKQGARNIGIIGILISASTTLLLAYSLFKPTLLFISLLMVIRGIGVGLAYLPTMTVGLSSLPAEKVTEGASLNNISRRLFSTLFIALTSLYISLRQTHLQRLNSENLINFNAQPIQEVFVITGLLLFLSVYSAIKLPRVRVED